jgi:4'-phosphopantetheinyl transferase
VNRDLQKRKGESSPVVWNPPRENLHLPFDQVHVWRLNLDLPEASIDDLWKTLSADEQQRTNRYRFERDRRWFIARRGRVRHILGEYLASDPASLKFSYNRYGKPALQMESQRWLSFNSSHSLGLALLACARQVDIGVDLEYRRENINFLDLAKKFFSTKEVAELRLLSMASLSQAFFLCWTRKEAFIKASGEGLSMPLDAFDVSVMPGEPARLLGTRQGLEPPDQWSLFNLEPDPEYSAALVVHGQGYELCCWAD